MQHNQANFRKLYEITNDEDVVINPMKNKFSCYLNDVNVKIDY